MWTRKSSTERERDVLAYLHRHDFYRRARQLAGDDEDRLRAVAGLVVLNVLRCRGQRARELREIAGVWGSTEWRHSWVEDGRRLRRAVDLVRQLERLKDPVEVFNFASAISHSDLRLVRVADDEAIR